MIDRTYGTYYILFFEDGSHAEIFDWDDIPAECKKYTSKLNHILMGNENQFNEFVPENYWEVTYTTEGMQITPNNAKLLTELLDRGLHSANIMTVATSMLISKYILKEIRSGQ